MAADKQALVALLTRGALQVEGQFMVGSNYSFLVTLELDGLSAQAIYKPQKGQMPLWDFPANSLAAREVAAYILSEALGWDLVPPTVIRRKAPLGKGSLQVFIPHNPEENYFTMDEGQRENLLPTALFDLLVNNADRKGSHILLDESGVIRLIDHGLCFHTDPKLRTVIWNFAGQAIPPHLLEDITSLRDDLLTEKPVTADLLSHLTAAELRAIARRIQDVLDHPLFPSPDPNRRPFPWPLV